MNKVKPLYEATDYKNLKELMYATVEKYSNNVAFIIKHKEDKETKYEEITYKNMLEDINKFGTALYEMGFKEKRIAIIGKNRYEWVLTHLTNQLRTNSIYST